MRALRRLLRLLGHVQARLRDGKGLGSTDGNGICHSFTPDGRCVSLLKI
jgi:predicted DNA-binding helix-hairpin-helix protein